MTARTRRPQINTACPVCKQTFRPEDRVFGLHGPDKFQFFVHAGCVTVREKQGQTVMEPKIPQTGAPFPWWLLVAALAALAPLAR